MYIRLQDTLLNLDLVKEVDPVTAHHYTPRLKRPHSDEEWIDRRPMTSEEEARQLAKTASEGPDYKYKVMYCVKVWFIGEKFCKLVKLGYDRIAARKLYEEFETLLNNNNPNIPHLKIEINE